MGAGGFYKFFKKNFAAQKIIDLNISWPSNFFKKYFITLPSNLVSYLRLTCSSNSGYYSQQCSNFKSLKKLIFTIIFKRSYSNKFSKKPLIFSGISKFFYNDYFKKVHHHLFNNQPTELSSSSEIDHIIQEGGVMFKKAPQ